MNVDFYFWALAFVLYLPLHIGGPLMFWLLQGQVSRIRRFWLHVLVHGLISAAVVFALAIYWWPDSRPAAVAIIVAGSITPWLCIPLWRLKNADELK